VKRLQGRLYSPTRRETEAQTHAPCRRPTTHGRSARASRGTAALAACSLLRRCARRVALRREVAPH
jgi:hypothetical protein